MNPRTRFLWITLLLLLGLICFGFACGDDDDDSGGGSGDDDDDDDDDNDDDDDDDDDDDNDNDDDNDDDDTTECSGCLIDEICYPQGVTNPDNVCEFCDTAASTTAWSDNDGAWCDDDVFCNGADTCSGGTCSQNAGDPCTDDGYWCNGDESCNEGSDSCDHTGNPCSTPDLCDEVGDGCVLSCTGCAIEDVCYGEGQANPDNVCEFCDTATSTTAWSDNDGAWCDDDVFCNGEDTCSGGACSQNAGDPCTDDGYWCNGDESCNEGTDSCDHSGNPCSAPYLCDEEGPECVLSCSDDMDDCGGACVDLESNPNHCGECDYECGEEEACHDGECLPLMNFGLYAIRDSDNSLRFFNLRTMTWTDIGSLGVTFEFGGLEYEADTDTLFMVDGRGAKGLYQVNLNTGAATLIGIHGITDLFGLALDPNTGILYGSQFSSGSNLYQLNKTTGAATLIGTMSAGLGGLAWDIPNNRLLGIHDGTGGCINEINITTAALTQLACPGNTNDSGFAYDPVNDLFWDIDYNGNLFKYDPNVGFARTTVLTGLGQHDGLAFAY